MTAAELLADLRDRGFSVEADADRLLVSPRSRLTDDDRERIRQVLQELLAALREPLHVLADTDVAIDCGACRHQSRRRTCLQPVAAGLVDEFEIVFTELLPAAQAAQCPAYSPRVLPMEMPS